jgi:hypothetical protein
MDFYQGTRVEQMDMTKAFVWVCLLVGYMSLFVVPFWRIFQKAGFSPWLSLLMPIPFINFAMFYFLAFVRWPNSK